MIPKDPLSPVPRKLIVNLGMLAGGEALSKILAFAAFAYLARILKPDVYGELEFALSVTLLFNLMVEGGLGLLGSREIAKNRQAALDLAYHIVLLRFGLAFLSFFLLLFFTYLTDKALSQKTLIFWFGFTLFATPGSLQWFFQGFDWMQWVAVSSVIRWILFAGGVFLLVDDPGKVSILPFIELVSLSAVVALHYGFLRRAFGPLRIKWNRSLALRTLIQAVPMGLTQIMWGLKIYLPTIVLGLLVGGEEVGWFGAGYRVVLALHTFVWMYFFNLYPSISRCSQHSPITLQSLAGNSLQLTSWAGVLIGALGVAFAPPFISFVYGPSYGETVICFQMLIWLIPLAFINGHYMYTLIAYNRPWLELSSAVFGGGASLLLNLCLIPRYGVVGAALGVLGSEASVLALNHYFVRKRIVTISFGRFLVRPIIAGSFALGMLRLISPANFWITGALALSICLFFLCLLQPDLVRRFRIFAGNRR